MIRQGTKVSWKWGNGTAEGKVKETFDKTITLTIKGNEVKRIGTPDNKALLIEQEDGDQVLKLTTEVERA